VSDDDPDDPAALGAALACKPIGFVRSPFTELAETPRQPRAAEGARGRIELLPGMGLDDAVADLAGWDYVWVIFWFHRVGGSARRGEGHYKAKVLPPRSERKRGVLSTRAPHRPNPIGLSAVRLLSVDGLTLHVEDLDLVDGTPVLDIKPYVPWTDAIPSARTGWLEPPEGHKPGGERPADPRPTWNVTFTRRADDQLAWLEEHGLTLDLRGRIEGALRLGPQPHAYRRIKRDERGTRIAVKDWYVRFEVDKDANGAERNVVPGIESRRREKERDRRSPRARRGLPAGELVKVWWGRALACVGALLSAAVTSSIGPPVRSQDRAAVGDERREVIDALVHGARLVTLEREPCDASRAFETDECASIRARDPATDRELWRTRVPIRVRGLIQLDLADADGAGAGYLLRAHDRGVLVGPEGRASAPFDVPTSTLGAHVGFEEAGGALLFREHGGCSVFVVGRTELGRGGRYVRGVESHVYARMGEPHDTVCFGFTIRPLGEVRVGTRPIAPGRRGELRHALSTLTLIAVTELHHPAPAEHPSVVALGERGIVWQVEVADEGWVIERAAMSGSGGAARCTVDVSDGTTHRRVELACASGRVLSRTTLPSGDTSSQDAGVQPDAGDPVIAYDRRGLELRRFPRCVVEERDRRFRVVFDGTPALESARRILVLDQRGEACIAVELAEPTHPADTLHRLTR